MIISTTHLIPENFRLIYFVFVYAIYIIGYTFQTACTKAAQTVLTNDPKQRPLFSLFDAIYNTILFIGGQMLISTVLVPKHHGFTYGFFKESFTYVIILSAIFTSLAVVSLWHKDVKENWGNVNVKTRFRDYWPIIKGNRPLQMLIISASTDKLATLTKTNAVTVVIIYGILMGNYSLSGKLMMITAIPTIIITFIGIGYARKLGLKRAYVLSTWLCLALSGIMFLFLVVTDLTKISITPLNGNTIIFLILLALITGIASVGGNIVIPMIADCSDYEFYCSGRYIPGMIGTIFSFVDKLISSVSTAFVGFMVALIGFKTALPTVDTPKSPELFTMGMMFFIGIPMFGWLCSLVAMRFYSLDRDKMQEVQQVIYDRKDENLRAVNEG